MKYVLGSEEGMEIYGLMTYVAYDIRREKKHKEQDT